MSFHRPASLALALLAGLAGCRAADTAAPTASSPAADEQAAVTGTCSTCVVGPVVLARQTGRPEPSTWQFSAPAGTTYTLHLDDLGTRGANAEVTFNGAVVPWRVDETGARRHRADIPLVSLAENTLAVRLTGKPGSQLAVSVEPPAPSAMATLTIAIGKVGLPPTSGALQGPANGRVTGPGIDCTLVNDVPGGDCAESYPVGTAVTLVQTPGDRSVFWEWYFDQPAAGGSVACRPDASGGCGVTMNTDLTLHVNFAPAPTRLEVTLVGPGNADVNGNEIMCYLANGVQGGLCALNYSGGVLAFSLRAYPKDMSFVGWSGACTGTELTCPLTSLPGDTVRVTATFAAMGAARSGP
jgi:hypothetical protein